MSDINTTTIVNRAEQIIEEAMKGGADAVKLQTYRADTITLNVDGTYTGASTDGESGAQSVTAQSLGGIKVNIEAPRGSVQSACKGTKLSATTDESGEAQLKF